MRVLLANPVRRGQSFGVNIDPVIARHTGARTKAGHFFPLGLASIAALLRENGHDCTILDPVPQGVGFDAVLAAANDCDLVVVPLATSNASGAFELFEGVRGAVRIFTGTYAGVVAEELLQGGRCDIVVAGEPELTILELCRQQGSARGVPGTSWMEGGRVVKNPARPLIEDLDGLPFPARDLVDNRLYRDPYFSAPTALVLTARGCPFDCVYCAGKAAYGSRVRYRSASRVIEELEEVVQVHGMKHVFFIDDTFTLNEKRLTEICDLMVEKRLGIQWICNGRVDTVTATMLAAMRRAGCREIRYGVESASAEILKNIGKGTTPEQAVNAFRLTREAGILPSAFFMLGCPGESRSSIRETVAFAKKLRPNYAMFNLVFPAPGSQLFERLEEGEKRRLGDKFDALACELSLCELSGAELARELKRAYRSYYLSGAFAVTLLGDFLRHPLRTAGMVRMLAQGARSMLAGG